MGRISDVLQDRIDRTQWLEPTPPVGGTISLPNTDDEESIVVREDVASADIGSALFISYVDSEGLGSCRRISVHTVRRIQGDLLLNCYCYERRAPRCFRASRIKEVTDLTTGEIIDDLDDLMRRLSGDLTVARESEAAATNAVLRSHKHALLVLVFLARCDGHQHPSETDVLMDYLDYCCAAPGLDIGLASDVIRRTHVDRTLAQRALRQLQKDDEQLRQVARHAYRLIEADGSLTPEEMEFGIAISEALGRDRS